MQLADLVGSDSDAAECKAAISSAVLAGIAAADAACCAALRERNRSQNHGDSAAMLGDIEPGGEEAPRHFERLIRVKDAAQYGLEDLSGQSLTAARRHARALIAFAERTLER